ncbi:hypothetical protein [Streptomyces sp. NPDC059009]|uniref:hypothetical protein n=1 Tax=Streptomyces sp. NPDC059009 TaxID=3346694 RepID=UPI00369DD5E1
MSTPSEPGESVPQEPPVVPEEAAAQDQAAEQQAADTAQLDAIRELATEIAKQQILAFDPATIRKGTVTAIASTSAPPTLSVQISGDTTTTIDGIRYIDSYAPEINDTVLIIKQGTDLVALGEIAGQFSESSWTTVSLAAGFSHNGNSNGNVEIRRIWDHGCWKVQMRGAANRSSGTLIANVPANYRPTARRSLLCTRTATGGSNVVKIDVETTGDINMVGGTTAPNGGNTGDESAHSHGMENNDHDHGGGVSYEGSHTHGIANNDHNHGGSTNSASGHTHGIQVTTHKHGSPADGEPGGTTSVNNHSHSLNTTTHKHGSATAGQPGGTTGTEAHHHSFAPTVDDPSWISFNQIEYFL